jgi:hypothetical protein
MKYEEFKLKCIERTDDDGYVKKGYVLHINDKDVMYLFTSKDKNNEYFIHVVYRGDFISDNIYAFEVDENHEYNIEWFVLEKEDV